MNSPIDISAVRLKTPRLLLRAWALTDLEDFYEYASVDGVGQMAGWAPHASREESMEILEHFIEDKKVLAIDYQGKVIGSIGIEFYNEEFFPELANYRCREIGYVLSKNYWGQGIMPEAVACVIDYLFGEKNLDCILCGYFLHNQQSARVQEKLGFKPYKRRQVETRIGTLEDCQENILWREAKQSL